MTYIEWVDYLSVLTDVPAGVSYEVGTAYAQFKIRLRRIVEYRKSEIVTEDDCVRLLRVLNNDIRAWNEQQH